MALPSAMGDLQRAARLHRVARGTYDAALQAVGTAWEAHLTTAEMIAALEREIARLEAESSE